MDISVQSTQYQVEDRSWLLSPHGTEPGTTPSVVLDISKFSSSADYPNGYIPSGYPLGVVTASGKYGPYDNAASDGRQTCKGLLLSAVRVVRQDGSTATSAGGAILVHGFVDETKLPGALDSAGQADLAHIIFNGVIEDAS
jgi:hypothetical protein